MLLEMTSDTIEKAGRDGGRKYIVGEEGEKPWK